MVNRLGPAMASAVPVHVTLTAVSPDILLPLMMMAVPETTVAAGQV